MTHDPLVLRATDPRGVVTLTLSRGGAFNSLSEAMLAALQGELDRGAAVDAAREGVVGAAGAPSAPGTPSPASPS